MTAPQLLMTNFVILAVIMTALWAYCVRIRDVSVIDAFWPLGMVILAGTTALLTDGSPVLSGVLLALGVLRPGWNAQADSGEKGGDERQMGVHVRLLLDRALMRARLWRGWPPNDQCHGIRDIKLAYLQPVRGNRHVRRRRLDRFAYDTVRERVMRRIGLALVSLVFCAFGAMAQERVKSFPL
jgi:hypothetical protein